jgi:hypothetical protein
MASDDPPFEVNAGSAAVAAKRGGSIPLHAHIFAFMPFSRASPQTECVPPVHAVAAAPSDTGGHCREHVPISLCPVAVLTIVRSSPYLWQRSRVISRTASPLIRMIETPEESSYAFMPFSRGSLHI